MNNPLISIIIPIYNKEDCLEKCVNSISNQTYKNLQIILVNDGSKDNSLNICKELAQKDSRILILDKPNGGAASARNFGLKHATGDYIGFCDADDYFDLDAYSTLLSVMQENNLDMIDCLYRYFTSNNKLVSEGSKDRTLEIQTPQQAIENLFLRTGNASLCTRLIKKEVIEGIEIPEGKRVEDFYFVILLLLKVKVNAIYNYPFYNITISENSVTRAKGGNIYFDAIYFYNLALETLKPYNYNLQESQRYYILKIYYLLAISLTKKERKKYKQQIKQAKTNLKTLKKFISIDKYLTKKEKIVLKLSCISFRLSRTLFLIKNIIKGKN